jgi:hypothetical protein
VRRPARALIVALNRYQIANTFEICSGTPGTRVYPNGTSANRDETVPDGFDAKASPFGVPFTAGRCSEPTWIGLAYAFEQATTRRVAPLP